MSAADDRHRAVEGYATSVTGRVLRLWGKVDPDEIRASWAGLSAEAFALVSVGQMAAATGADAYMDAAWTESHPVAPVSLGRVQPRSLAGVASDGRNLLTLLQQPAISALAQIGRGATPAQALAASGNSLAVITGTQVADAGRAAESVALTARPRISGYIRVLSTPSCSRCAILAGKWFRYNEGFRRHPRCDCQHLPADEPTGPLTAPWDYFNSLPRAQQDRYFGKDDAEAIRDGKDLIRLVNQRTRKQVVKVRPATADRPSGKPFTVADTGAHARMQDAFKRAADAAMAGDRVLAERFRSEARALADTAYGRTPRTGPQVMPEQVIAAASSRAEAIEGLHALGYVA